MVTHATVSPVVNDYTGETTCVLDGRTITLHDDHTDADAGWTATAGWWFGRSGEVWGDSLDWSGSAEQLLLWHLLDDGATLADPCPLCSGEGRADCPDCDGSGFASCVDLAEELDRLYGRPT